MLNCELLQLNPDMIQPIDNRLINYFLKITNLTTDEIQVLTESMMVKNFKKGDYLVKEGQLHHDSYFLLEGLVREFKLVEGYDISTAFYTEEQWIISLDGFEGKKPSKYNLICVENTTLVVGNEQKARELFRQFPHFETVSRQVMETVFEERQHQVTSYITQNPEQRYLNLLKNRPDIFQRVPQYDIATYIGVKPESLSRIRRKLYRKG